MLRNKASGSIMEVAFTSIQWNYTKNFVVKPKQSFVQPTHIFVFHWHFVDFLMIFTQ